MLNKAIMRKKVIYFLFSVQFLLALLFVISPPEALAVWVCEDNSACGWCFDCAPSDSIQVCNGEQTIVHTLHDYLCGACFTGYMCCYDSRVYCNSTGELIYEWINGPYYPGGSCDICPLCNDNDGDGYTTCNDDCDDNDPTIHPGAPEICDGKDNNCDGVVDECCDDNDGDGYSASCDGDCDDNDPDVNPGASEICDGKDNNCDTLIDETCSGGGGGGDDGGDDGGGDGDDGDGNCNEESNSTNMGSSTNLASGNLYHSQQVLSSHGAGLSANIAIFYNSLDTTIGSFGRGWTHSYGTNIIDKGDTLAHKEKNGKIVYYHNIGGDTYMPESSSGRYSRIIKNLDGTYVLKRKSGKELRFDTSGRFINITDRNNNVTTLTYTGDDLTSITDSSGRVTTLNYSNGKISSITDPAGRTNTFTYDGDFLSTLTGPSGGVWTYTYDADGRMLTKTNPLGNTTAYSYDSYGKLTTSQDPAGNYKTITYDQTNKTATVTEKNNTQWTYVYDNSLNVPTQITDPDANQATYQYDSNRNLLSEIKNGITTTYTYDTNGNMLTKIEAFGTSLQRTTSYTYNEFGEALTMTDPDGNTTTYTYDPNGNLTQEQDAQNNITSHTYGSKGERLTTTDPNGNITTYTYDAYGNVASVKNALNQATTYSYDIMGNLLSTTDANGNTTTYQYDLRDRLIRQTNPDGGIINYEYDLAGNRTAIIDANGNRSNFTYDNLNRLIKITDPQGNSTNYTYDSEGNMTSMTIKDSNNNVMTSETDTYDIYNRLIRTTHLDGTYTEQSYDTYGNISTKRDENGNITIFAYDALNRLISITDPNTGITSYTYDKRNNLLAVTDANSNVTTYNYDSLNRLTSTISPDTGTSTYTYDANGNMTSKTDANGVITTYVYDALNRQTLIQFPDSTQNITYAYDNCTNGKVRLCMMTDPSGTTWYDYDKMGRVTMETKQINNLYYRTEYSYDLNGNLSTITYPGGRKITYNYNQLNKVTSVTETFAGVTKTLASNITYLPFGDIASMTYGNGIVTTKAYSNRYQLNSLNIGTLKQLSYSRDNAGNITAITDNLNPSKNKSYIYDSIYRLTRATGSWGLISYGYDFVGNRTYETTHIENTIYNYSGNRLTSSFGSKAFNFGYDNNGNTTTENTKQYIYNQNQRLIKVMNGSNVLGEYIYNGKGQRVEKWIPSENKCTIFHYDQNGLLIAESTSAGNIKTEYVYLNGQPLAKIEGANTYYYHNDHLGTPMLMTDTVGTKVWEIEAKPFGEPMSVSGSITNNLRFPGQYYDSETGLHQNYFRDYNSAVGRYAEADISGIMRGTTHLYFYAKNNPIIFTDPRGLFSIREAVFHYFFEKGPVTVNFSEVDIGLQPKDFPGFKMALAIMYKQEGSLSFETSTGRDIGGWAGHVTYNLKGTIESNKCEWKFAGYIGAFNDRFDFNALPWGERKYWAEIITRLIGFLPIGNPYDINFNGHRIVTDSGKW